MNIAIITQDDPFYLGRSLDYFFNKLPENICVAGIVILEASPFGKPESFLKRIIRAFNVFGLKFFLRYSYKYILSKYFFREYLVSSVLKKYDIRNIRLPNKNINSSESIKTLNNYNLDLVISISCNQIFRKKLLKLPKVGCLNLHTALLPNYKGLMPTFWALRNGEREIGVSIFFMDEGIDTGDILIQKIISIENNDTLESLIEKTKIAGMDALVEAINLIKRGNYKTVRFSPDEGTYYSFPTKTDVKEFRRAGKRFW